MKQVSLPPRRFKPSFRKIALAESLAAAVVFFLAALTGITAETAMHQTSMEYFPRVSKVDAGRYRRQDDDHN